RLEIELQIAESISKVNDLAADLSLVGSRLDRLGDQLGFADIELASVQEQIEEQAVDAYMAVLASPSLTLVGTGTVEKALVVSTVVDDVIAGGRQTVGELFIRKRGLQDLHVLFLTEQDEFTLRKAAVDAELEHLTQLYAAADQAVADAMRRA